MRIKTVEITFDKLNSIFEAIIQLDSDRKDQVITMKEYDAVKDKTTIKGLIGGRTISDWNSFKAAFVEFQSQYGITWTPVQGMGGPLKLEEINLPSNLGEELAKEIFESVPANKDNEPINLYDLLKSKIPALYKYIDDISIARYLSLPDFREGIKSYSKNNYGFKFKQGRSPSFYKVINEYTYGNDTKHQAEVEFGKEIESKLKEALSLDFIAHTQLFRENAKFMNCDFLGLKKTIGPRCDDLSIYAFELKPSNKIVSISEAISQATNYKSRADYSYIIIPMFDKKLFPDDVRLSSYFKLCEDNGIGIMTVEMNVKKNTVLDIYQVVAPVKNEITDFTWLQNLMVENNLEFCPLCKKVVSTDESREGCGWMVTNGADSKCMKKLMEEKMLKI